MEMIIMRISCDTEMRMFMDYILYYHSFVIIIHNICWVTRGWICTNFVLKIIESCLDDIFKKWEEENWSL